jgi:hypothetical protein|tara:strand:- start:140 stop:334 length:195 start_codon:yes stop_codon:yes gene_type:complete
MGFLDVKELDVRYARLQVILAMSRPLETLVITLTAVTPIAILNKKTCTPSEVDRIINEKQVVNE